MVLDGREPLGMSPAQRITRPSVKSMVARSPARVTTAISGRSSSTSKEDLPPFISPGGGACHFPTPGAHPRATRAGCRRPNRTLSKVNVDGQSRFTALAFVLCLFYHPAMTDPTERLTPADPHHFLACLAQALTSDGRLAKQQSAELLATIVAERIAARLEKDGFVIMRRPPSVGGAALGRGFEGK